MDYSTGRIMGWEYLDLASNQDKLVSRFAKTYKRISYSTGFWTLTGCHCDGGLAGVFCKHVNIEKTNLTIPPAGFVIFHVICFINSMIDKQHFPKGAVWILRDGVWSPLIIHLAPFGRFRHILVLFWRVCPHIYWIFPINVYQDE